MKTEQGSDVSNTGFFKKTALAALCAVLLGGAWFLVSNQNNLPKTPPTPPQQAMPVQVSNPITHRLVEWDEYTGRFRASERVEVRARVSGYLDKIHFEDGQKVKKDQVLFTIDPRPYRIAKERAQAIYVRAEKEYERTKTLRKSSSISQQELENDFQVFRASKANLDEANLNLEFTEVKAPISGRASRNFSDIGNLVTGGINDATLLTTIVSLDPINFYFEASENDILKYIALDNDDIWESLTSMKRPVYVKLSKDQEFIHKGTIDFVDNEIDRSTGTLQLRALFDNKDDVFVPGMFGRIRIAATKEYSAILVPDSIIGINQTQQFVYIVDDNNIVQTRQIETGPLYQNRWRIIRKGLQTSDRVITSGLAILRPGMKVSPKDTPQAQPTSSKSEN